MGGLHSPPSMEPPLTHPEPSRAESGITDGYSLEVTARSMAALTTSASRIMPGASIFVPDLPGDDDDARLAALSAIRGLGFEPVPHLSARHVPSLAALASFVRRAVTEAGVERCFIIAGDLSSATGPFSDSTSLIETGVFERAGIKVIGVGGHPQAHPVMSEAERWDALAGKCRRIEQRGMAPLIVTQFAFDADIVLAWLQQLRAHGIDHPVRVGVPGPAGVAVLVRYAALCGVSASASMWSKYGLSIGKLLGTAGPGLFVDRLASGLTAAHGQVSLHVFPFGGIAQSVAWIEQYRDRHAASAMGSG